LNWIDALVLATGIVAVLIGYWRGFLQSLVVLVIFGASLAISSRYGERVGELFSPLTDDVDIQTIAGLSVIFIGFILLVLLAIRILTFLRTFWQRTIAFKFNRLAGAVLGLGAGFILVVGLLTASQHFAINNLEQDIEDSALGLFVADTVDQTVRFIRLIPRDWVEISDNRNRDALAAPPLLYQPPPSPRDLRHLAEYYAPILFMDTAKSLPKADYLTTWDYDGDLNPRNNWNNLNRDDVDFRGRVYYWVLETEGYWFIGYGFFHPRDWGETEVVECTADREATQLGCHENDLEGVLLAVQRSADHPYGDFLTMETVSHFDILSFKDYQQTPSSQVSGHFPLCSERVCDVQFLEGTGRPFVYIEAKGHAVKGASRGAARWEQNFPGGDGILYFPTGSGQVPSDGDDRSASYELVDISELWRLRDDSSIFTVESEGVGGNFLGDDGAINAASPPWRWIDQDQPGAGHGALFLDPARWINDVHNGLVPWPVEYAARSYEVDAKTPSLTAAFDWSMPARFGMDADGDGLIDYFTTPGSVSPGSWLVHLNGCGSTATGGSIREYTWAIDGIQHAAETACDGFSFQFPGEGTYQVTLTVASQDGQTASHSQELVVQDWLIVSLGDSFASGQGSPDIPIFYEAGNWLARRGFTEEGCFMDERGFLPGIVDPPGGTKQSGARCFALRALDSPLETTWQDEPCRRSARAGPAQAALLLENDDPRTSVTLVHLACARGTISDLRGQIDAANSLIADREIDALLISIGGNDAGFRNIVQMCANQEPCFDANYSVVAEIAGCEFARLLNKFEDCEKYITEFGGIPGSASAQRSFYDAIYNVGCSTLGPNCRRLLDSFAAFRSNELAGLNGLTSPDSLVQRQARVYITEYPGVTRDDAGDYCQANFVTVIPGWSASELEWADTVVTKQINQTVSQAAQDAGWSFIGGIYAGFLTHGLCAEDHWVVRLHESFVDQGEPFGAVHPNHEGYAFYAQRIAEELAADFYTDGNLDLPRKPD